MSDFNQLENGGCVYEDEGFSIATSAENIRLSQYIVQRLFQLENRRSDIWVGINAWNVGRNFFENRQSRNYGDRIGSEKWRSRNVKVFDNNTGRRNLPCRDGERALNADDTEFSVELIHRRLLDLKRRFIHGIYLFTFTNQLIWSFVYSVQSTEEWHSKNED